MDNLYEILKHSLLFQGINQPDFDILLECLCAKQVSFDKNEVILFNGDRVEQVGMVLNGRVQILKQDYEGREIILAELAAPEMFAEVFACAGIQHSPVMVKSVSSSEILLIDYQKIISSCPSSCPFHAQLISNMIKLIANKNIYLNTKIEILSKRTIREKLICFLNLYHKGETAFTVPYNREEMANFICADRSAMSAELGKMQKEGLIRFNKNNFEITGDLFKHA